MNFRQRGFTLIELQTSLLLAILVLGSLFLFTRYFRVNYVAYQESLSFHREANSFYDWLNKNMNHAREIRVSGEEVRFELVNGKTRVLHLRSSGPMVGDVAFFSSPVQATVNVQIDRGVFKALAHFQSGKHGASFQRQWISAPGMGLQEVAFGY